MRESIRLYIDMILEKTTCQMLYIDFSALGANNYIFIRTTFYIAKSPEIRQGRPQVGVLEA